MKPNIEMTKNTMILMAGIAASGLLFFLLIRPASLRVSKVSQEVKVLDSELIGVREALKRGNNLDQERHLLKRNEVSVALNEIMRAGADLNIDFLSTNPQQIHQPQGSKHPILPINLEIQSTYKNLGLFFGILERLNKSIVTVREFTIERRQEILPEIHTELIVDIYLKEGEGE